MKTMKRYYDENGYTSKAGKFVVKQRRPVYASAQWGDTDGVWLLQIDTNLLKPDALADALANIDGVRRIGNATKWEVSFADAERLSARILAAFESAGLPLVTLYHHENFPGAMARPRSQQGWIDAGWVDCLNV